MDRLPFAPVQIGGIIYGAPEFDDEGFTANRIFEATELRMVDFVFFYDPDEQPITILYEYDFGDNWRHLLRLERLPREAGAALQLAGQGRQRTSAARTAMPSSSKHGATAVTKSIRPCAGGPAANFIPKTATSTP